MDSLKIVENPIKTDGYGIKTAWRILVNGVEITDHAKPFTASDESGILHECRSGFMCSGYDLSIRRWGDSIIWFGDDPYMKEVEPGLPKHSISGFKSDEYQADQAEMGAGNVDLLPTLSDSELRRLFALQEVPDWRAALYTIPDLVRDKNGQTLLRLIHKVIADQAVDCQPATPPQKYLQVAIGLDYPDLPESIIEVGINSEPALRLMHRPCFPIWISGGSLIREISSLVNRDNFL
ncbi:MAG: hypothetical protein O2820_10190 [Planctomycetota bacterium]|nr:hypothetical protein [Planctomycetota bacterium]MDA1249583.1 hypothetical protein [Planctomycetota bacterium]